MACILCETRRPRRFCSGVSGNICSVCCGTEREVSISCPLDCEYLQDARIHDKPLEIDPEQVPDQDIRITERFLRDNELLLMGSARALTETALKTHGVVDNDVREALNSLVRTYRTLESGLYYESKPANPLAAGIFERMQESFEEQRRMLAERYGIATVRDSDILGVLVFLERLELQHNNGRKRGRAFLDFLLTNFSAPDSPIAPESSPLIIG